MPPDTRIIVIPAPLLGTSTEVVPGIGVEALPVLPPLNAQGILAAI